LGRRVCRNATQYLVRLYLVSMVEHAKAWLAEEKKSLGDDLLELLEHLQQKAGHSSATDSKAA
jgi:hypothetical protein